MQSRRITSYFKRPAFALAAQEDQPRSLTEPPLPRSSPPLSVPLSESLPSDSATSQSPDGPALQLSQSLLISTKSSFEDDKEPQRSVQTAETGISFSSSQRVIKNGKEVVISSDGDDTDSVRSFESPEDLLNLFMGSRDIIAKNKEIDDEYSREGMTLRTRKSNKNAKRGSSLKARPPVYKNTLDDLVMQAVDDNETEAEIQKFRASLLNSHSRLDKSAAMNHEGKKLHEGILATALNDEENDEHGFKRLLDAVRRTEAFDLGKTWTFFDNDVSLPPSPNFPQDSISPGTYISGLREPESRERTFHSGIVDFALSRELLPDSLITWVFFSIASESRDSLRHAYCRALKHTPAERIASLIRPEDFDTLFQQLGANPKALNLSEAIVPDTHPKHGRTQIAPQYRAPLISILDVIRETANLLSSVSREHILIILLRLTLDASLTSDSSICLQLERALTAAFESITRDAVDDVANRICITIYNTLKDAELQGRLLQHIIPTLDWVAALRRRLAFIFLTNDLAVDMEAENVMIEINRIIDILKDQRFDVKKFKRTNKTEYDYGELGAIVTLLNIVIDSGWSESKFLDKQTKRNFNSHVDLLAERVKKIFTSIEDSGASHLKRTLAKEALESLHYRILYAVRTSPPPRKLIYETESPKKKQTRLEWINKGERVSIQAGNSPAN